MSTRAADLTEWLRQRVAIAASNGIVVGLSGGIDSAVVVRLAQIALTEKKPQDCLKCCRELLQEKSTVDVATVLRLMAGAYEQTGERDKAIRCLSGELP